MAYQKINQVTVMIGGLQTKLPPGFTGPLVVNGQSYTVKQIVAILSAFMPLVAAEADAKVQYHQAVKQVVAQRPVVRALMTGLGDTLRVLFGKGSPELAPFGVSSGKRRAPTIKVKSAGQDQAQATRVARHTLGKKQRLKVKAAPPASGSTSGK